MAYVGSMGDIPFVVSSFQVLTFRDYSRGASSRIATHDLIGRKSTMELIGQSPEEISLKIKLSAQLGVNPTEVLKKLRRMRDKGTLFPLIIGFGPVSNEFWTITSIGETVSHWTGLGNVLSVDVDVTLREYVI